MSDLRQGVTPAVHDVLDRLDALRRINHASLEPRMMMMASHADAKRACDCSHPAALRRQDAIDAAARALLMLESLEPELSR